MSVVCFPGAGSFGAEFKSLLDAVPGTLAKYPGRFGRDFGIPASSFDEVVGACAGQATGRPVLVGHSFGAYVAYATASKVEAAALVVAGAAAPDLLKVPAVGSSAETIEYLAGVDPAAVPSGEWREVVAEAARHDLRLLAEFEAAAPLECPVFAVRGDGDPLTSKETVAAWEGYTSGAFSMREFSGGHSDFLSGAGFVPWLTGALLPSPR